jgi:SAM-dependent methyltransferase
MANETASLDLHAWLQTPAGRYLLAWEAARLDAAVVDVFGFHALQLGWPGLPALQANRMPQRWLALEAPGGDLQCDFDALPFPENSLDLLVLPHTLEMAADPHHRLREAARVLRPEGRLFLLGFNPVSLWGLRSQLTPALPPRRQWIGYWRLRDWLRLLGFDIDRAQFGAYSPAWGTESWLARSAWMDRLGPTWWPVFGAVYFIEATKRVHGMRLVGLARQRATGRHQQSAVAIHSQKERA